MIYETIIDFNDISLEVSGVYTAGEREILYHPDMSGSPACPSEFELHSVNYRNWELISVLSDEDIDELNELIINQIENE